VIRCRSLTTDNLTLLGLTTEDVVDDVFSLCCCESRSSEFDALLTSDDLRRHKESEKSFLSWIPHSLLYRTKSTDLDHTVKRSNQRCETMVYFSASTSIIALLLLLLNSVESFAIAGRSVGERKSARTHGFDVRLLRMSNNDDDMDDDDDDEKENQGPSSINVLGTSLVPCCTNVRETGIGTGFYRNGYCSTGEQDLGRHTVCIEATDEFLEFSKSVGNDLSTPVPQYMFPGLKEGDIWCLCAQRWAQAFNVGKAPKLFLQATHEKTLDYIPFEILRVHALDREEADKALDVLNEQRSRLDKLV
jgi:uncharacterized protein (DUF2237 family)